MGSIVLWLADGTAFFTGLVLVVVGLPFLVVWQRLRLLRVVPAAGIAIGAAIAVLSSAPQPLWLLVAWGASSAAAFCIVFVPIRSRSLRLSRRMAVAFAVILTAALGLAEMRYRLDPAIPAPPGRTVHAIGDSVSAGIRDGERPWPAILEDLTGLAVVNLARPGATAESALNQAAAIPDGPGLVMVEIGGNDLLGGASAAAFRRHLDALLGEIRRKGASIVLFELPLPPFQDDFGRVQRSLAREYGAVLVPKKVLASVFRLEGGTLDGIHLSPRGHEALARAVADRIASSARGASAPLPN